MTEQDGINLVRRIFPEVSEQEAGYLLWNETGFPAFYYGDPEVYFAAQLNEFKERCNAKE